MKPRFAQPTDLTFGPPLPVLCRYALPMLVSMFFQQAYQMADSWIAGRCIGAAALGAVGTCYPVTVFCIAIASGLSLGVSILCSQRYGAKRLAGVKTCITTALTSFLPLSAGFAAVGAALCPSLLEWLAVAPQVRPIAAEYLAVYCAGMPFVFLYNLTNGVLTGLGDSKTPLVFLTVSSVCNIALDLLLVAWLPLGVAGLALATLLSQAAAAFLTALAVRKIYQSWQQAAPLWEWSSLQAILRLGIPSMLQHLAMALGQMALQNVINGYGLAVMAGYSVAFRINGVVINSLMALSNALSGYAAQNLGAGKDSRVREGIRAALAISYVFSALIVWVLLRFGEPLLGLFLKKEAGWQEVVSAGMGFFRVVAPFYLLVCLKIVFDGALRGLGAMRPFLLATLSDVAVRIALGRPVSNRFGIQGVWAIWPLAWLVGTVLSAGAYWAKYRKR